MNIRTYIRELIRGKSVPRALLAEPCSRVRLSGNGIDLGSKDSGGLQYRYMNVSNASITYTDSRPANPNVIKVDIEKRLPFDDASFDFVMMFFLLEHVYNFQHALSEAARLLKPGGKLVGVVPQMERFHPDPDDFFRFTTSGLERSMQNAGFPDVKLTLLGIGPFTAGAHIATSATRLRLPFALAALGLDMIMEKMLRRRWRQTYSLSIFFEATT